MGCGDWPRPAPPGWWSDRDRWTVGRSPPRGRWSGRSGSPTTSPVASRGRPGAPGPCGARRSPLESRRRPGGRATREDLGHLRGSNYRRIGKTPGQRPVFSPATRRVAAGQKLSPLGPYRSTQHPQRSSSGWGRGGGAWPERRGDPEGPSLAKRKPTSGGGGWPASPSARSAGPLGIPTPQSPGYCGGLEAFPRPGRARPPHVGCRWPCGRRSPGVWRPVSRCGPWPPVWNGPPPPSREVTSNGDREHYRACAAHHRAQAQARRPKVPKLVRFPALRALVEAKLGNLQWSPAQISAWLATTYPEDPTMQISPEAIYQSLYIQGRGALRKELTAALRSGRAMRRAGKSAVGRGKLKDMVLIAERPPEVADRAVPGHWEGDLIIGQGGRSAIGTLVERTSRFVMLLHLPENHGAEFVRYALQDAVATLPAALWRSITWDQGKELAEHARFKVATGVQVYFCDPHSPWQRGSNENTNG